MEHSHKRTNRPSDINAINQYSELHFCDLDTKNIFSTPFWSMKIECNNEEIVNECYNLKDKCPNGVIKSNFGGWQSPVFDFNTIRHGVTPQIKNLAENVKEITAELLEDSFGDESLTHFKNDIGWWINVNNGFSYNVHHTHPGCSMIAIYYAKIPQIVKSNIRDEGQLVILRQDASCHSDILSNIDSMCEIKISPKEQYLYIMPSYLAHYVTAHTSNDDRISIAFNIG